MRWGSRFVEVRTRNGPVYREVPLTWEDLFDPQEGDLMVHGTLHGQIIRVVLPELTEERRREYIKVAKTKAEDAKVSIRNIRRHAKETLDHLSRDGEAGEDDVARAEKHLEQVTKQHVDAIDDLLKRKETELLDV